MVFICTKMEPTKMHVSYEEIHKIVGRLSKTIFTEFSPEVIIGIGGGGLLPARLFRTALKIPMYAVFISFYEDGVEESNASGPQKTQWLDQTALDFMRGKRILIVDEISDSGATLHYCVEEVLKTCDPSKVSVAVLHDKMREKSKILDLSTVSYYVGLYTDDVWVTYPWSSIPIAFQESPASTCVMI